MAGFIFIQWHLPAKYHHKRSDGWDMYLHAGMWGALVSLVHTIPYFIFLLVLYCFLPEKRIWSAISSYVETHAAFFSFTSLLTSYILGRLSKRYYSDLERREEKINQLVQANANSLEKSLMSCCREGKDLLIVTDNKHVFIGPVVTPIVEHGKIEFIEIIPLLIGYETEEKQRFEFTELRTDNYINEKSEESLATICIEMSKVTYSQPCLILDYVEAQSD